MNEPIQAARTLLKQVDVGSLVYRNGFRAVKNCLTIISDFADLSLLRAEPAFYW
jgi:hypothetical protein